VRIVEIIRSGTNGQRIGVSSSLGNTPGALIADKGREFEMPRRENRQEEQVNSKLKKKIKQKGARTKYR
jgi:hypothetical protein